jgi:hypothetical protein
MTGQPRHIPNRSAKEWTKFLNNLNHGSQTQTVPISKDNIKQYVKAKYGIINGAFGSVSNSQTISSGILDVTQDSTGDILIRRTFHINPETGTTDTLIGIETDGLELPYQEMILLGVVGDTITITHNSGSVAGTQKSIQCPQNTDYTLSGDEGIYLVYDTSITSWIITGGTGGGGADNLGNHTATQDINLSNNELDNFNKLNQQNANTTGSLNFVFDASMRWKDTAGTGEAIFRFGSGDAFSFDHQINGTDIVLSGNLTVNGLTVLGNASTDSIFTIGTISSLYALDLEGGGRVKSNDSSEIGLFIKNETGTLGTEGTVQIPEATSATAPTNTQLDGTFGAFTGAVGLFRDTDTTTNSRFYIRGSDSNWYYSFLTQQT